MTTKYFIECVSTTHQNNQKTFLYGKHGFFRECKVGDPVKLWASDFGYTSKSAAEKQRLKIEESISKWNSEHSSNWKNSIKIVTVEI